MCPAMLSESKAWVGWPVVGQHHIVGDIHQGVDGPHAHPPDAALHPEGGGLHGQTLYRRADIAGAALRILHGNGEAVGPGIAGKGRQLLQGQVIQSRQLPGDAVMAPQVGPVGHGLVVDFQDDVVQVQGVGNGGARRSVEIAEVQNVGLLRGGEQISQADLRRAADHAVALDAPELGLLDLHRLALTVPAAHGPGGRHGHLHARADVGAAAYDVPDVAAADVGAADLQLVGVGMGAHLHDPAHQHVVEPPGQVLGPFHLHGGHGQVIGQPRQVHVLGQVHVILDPIQ